MKKLISAQFGLILLLGAAFAPISTKAYLGDYFYYFNQFDYPVRISAPAIKLNSPIQMVGVNQKGEMDVPSGASSKVGWYQGGVLPGTPGTAVFDAHVFAAFSRLNELTEGQDIYIYMHSGRQLHFVISQTQTYALKNLSPQTLFSATTEKQINLITCAGKLTADRSTYDHRLIVSAKQV